MSKRKKTKRILKIVLRIFILFVALTLIPVIIYTFIHPPVTPLMLIRRAEIKDTDRAAHIEHKWIPIEKMSSHLYNAAVAAEDDHFMTHFGFDFGAMKLAFESNQEDGKRIKGGSTISQQTAKNVFLWPRRDYVRKGLEAWFTVLIELVWSKERIMEVYLNIVELGDGVFGVESASQKYFKKPASQLTKYEAAALIAVLPNPHIYKVLNPSAYTQRYKNAIVSRMSRMQKVNFN